jgi:flagellar biosynthesis/type III secretory pathway ATPase
MAACDPVTYQGVTASVFQSVKQELENNGFSVPGTSGTIRGPYGIVIDYAWNEPAESLYIHVVDKSFFVPCSQIHSQLNNALTKFIA